MIQIYNLPGMDLNVSGITNQQIYAFIVLMAVCIIQLTFFIVSRKYLFNPERTATPSRERFQSMQFLKMKLYGFLMMGIIPYLFFSTIMISPVANDPAISVFWRIPSHILLILPILIIIMNFFVASKEDFHARIPQMRITEWGIPNLIISIGGWGIYLLGYEYLFRGLFLSSWVEAFGPITAIAVNVFFYSLFHIPNGTKEAVGAIPFGIILCLLTIQMGSFLPAFLLHWLLSVSAEIFSIHHHPDMQFNLKKLHVWKDIS